MSSCFAYDVHTFDRTLSMSETAFCSKPVARPPPLVASFADNVSDYVLAGQTNISETVSQASLRYSIAGFGPLTLLPRTLLRSVRMFSMGPTSQIC